MNINFDKLRDLKSGSDNKKGFIFRCGLCHSGSEHLTPYPIGVTYKPYENLNGSLVPFMNKDLYDMKIGQLDIGRYFDNLPTIRQALLSLSKENIYFGCDSCEGISSVPKQIELDELKKFIKASYKEGIRY